MGPAFLVFFSLAGQNFKSLHPYFIGFVLILFCICIKLGIAFSVCTEGFSMYISAEGLLADRCLQVWFLFAALCQCVCICACGLPPMDFGGRNKKLEHKDSVSSVCPPQDT